MTVVDGNEMEGSISDMVESMVALTRIEIQAGRV